MECVVKTGAVANVLSASRYFKNYKLDYPNTETQKGSKKFVKAMKKLHVSITFYPYTKTYADLLRKPYRRTPNSTENSSTC